MTVDHGAPGCAHCGLPVPAGLVEPSADEQFCCAGCRVVAETLRESGLAGDYYALRARFDDGAEAAPARAGARSYAAFDREAFLAEHVHEVLDDAGAPTGLARIDLLLEGVRCAACVWLVERLPKLVPGVVEAQLRLRDARVTLTYDKGAVALSTIAARLDAVGYPPHPARSATHRELAKKAERRHLVRMGAAAVCAGNAMLVAFALYSAEPGDLTRGQEALFRYTGLGLGWLSLAWPGRPFLSGALAALKTRTANLDLPIAIALVVGALAGTWNTISGRGEAYFDSLTVLVLLLLAGRYVQARQQRWAEDAVDLTRSLTPATCRVARGENQVDEITLAELEPGDEVLVRSGEPLPADGVVVSGSSRLDRALLTGESEPVATGPGDEVHAGCQNVGRELRVRVTTVGAASRLGRLMGLVEEGLGQKPPIERFTDRVAGWFVAVVCTLAAVTFAGWSVAAGLGPAIDHTVALLIVACPCALGLATPLTLAVAVGRAARSGMFVKDAAVFERLAKSGRLVLDKTGTVTRGEPALTAWYDLRGGRDDDARAAVALIEARSEHPLGRALQRALERHVPAGATASDVLERLDGGISGTVLGRTYRIGSRRHLAQHGFVPEGELEHTARELEEAGSSIVLVARDGEGVVAAMGLSDSPRPRAAAAIAELRAASWQPEILSGDAAGAVSRIADEVGVASARGAADPEDKLARVRELQAAGEAVVMVGDGVNDAAALAAADVGVAVHGGAEASLAAADVYASRPGLAPLVELRALAARTMRTIRRNLALSLLYNVVGVTLAMAGLMDPLVAAILMPISSASVLMLAIVSLGRPGRTPAARAEAPPHEEPLPCP